MAFLPDPFQFTPGNEFAEVADILRIRSKDPLQELIRELLVAEFNHVSGKGIDPDLQTVLLKWAEAVVVEAGGFGPSGASKGNGLRAAAAAGEEGVKDALRILLLLNGATGGGSGGGG